MAGATGHQRRLCARSRLLNISMCNHLHIHRQALKSQFVYSVWMCHLITAYPLPDHRCGLLFATRSHCGSAFLKTSFTVKNKETLSKKKLKNRFNTCGDCVQEHAFLLLLRQMLGK